MLVIYHVARKGNETRTTFVAIAIEDSALVIKNDEDFYAREK